MFRKDLKELAAKCGLYVQGRMAYGCPQGIWTALTMHRKLVRLCLYVGAADAVPEGTPTRISANALAICKAVQGCLDGDNAYGLSSADTVAMGQNGSLVYIHFVRDEGMFVRIPRFMAEVLPPLLPLTNGMQCIHCGGNTGGQGVPVRFAADAVVPMHTVCLTACQQGYEAMQHPPVDTKRLRKPLLTCAGIALAVALLWMLLPDAAWLNGLLLFLLAGGIAAAYLLLKGPGGWVRHVTLGVSVGAASLLGMLGQQILGLVSRYRALGAVANRMMRLSVYIRVELGSAWLMPLLIATCAGLVIAGGSVLYDRLRRRNPQMPRPASLPGKA